MKMKNQRRERMKLRKEMRMYATTALPNLPNEVIDEIFLRLPVKTLLELRCVIRDYSRFHNPNFIKMHLNRQIEIDNGSTFIVTIHSLIYKVNSGSSFPVQLKIPFSNPACESPTLVVGSCYGLVCLTHECCYGEVVYLWNPATGEHKQLPAHNIDIILSRIALGFGYDHNSGKFKVLAITGGKERRTGLFKVEATVYTLRVGNSSWRSIGEVQYRLWESKPQVFGGCPHWIVHSLKSVVAFSFGEERFKEIPLPMFDNAGPKVLDLTALKGRLSIFSYVIILNSYELWVKVDNGLENTWTKQLSFNELDIPRFMDGCHTGINRYGFGLIKLYGFKNCWDSLCDDEPIANNIISMYPCCKLNDFFVYSYVESLAMVNGEDTSDVQQNSKKGVNNYRLGC